MNGDRTEKSRTIDKGTDMAAAQTPLISVVVPVYRVEQFVRECIDSILSQSYSNLELILVDDGSPDGCGKICDEYAEEDDRVKVIHKENGGLSDARNAGLDVADGEYIFLTDSDDFIHRDTLKCMYEAVSATGSDMALCNIQYVDERGKPIYGQDSCREYCVRDGVWGVDDFWTAYRKNGKIVCVVAWNKLYRRKLFDDLRYPKGKVREDEFLIHRIVSRCSRICCVDRKLCYYRQRDMSTMAQSYKIDQMDAVEAYIDRTNFYNELGRDSAAELALLDAVAFLEWYGVGMNRDDEDTVVRYEKLKCAVCDLGEKQYSHHPSMMFRIVMGLYRRGLFPYRFLRSVWWKLDGIRKRLRGGSHQD